MGDNGYIKLNRRLLSSRVFYNSDLLKVWIWCLLKASHSERVWEPVKTGVGETEVELKPGQFVFGRLKAAKELKMKQSSIRNRMQKLKDMRNLDIQADSHFSIVTILNWDTYQNKNLDDGQIEGQAQDKHRTSTGQAQDTDKNVKNVKNVENVNNTLPPPNGRAKENDPADEIIQYASTLDLPKLPTKNSIDKAKATIRARIKGGYSAQELKDHLRRYVEKKHAHLLFQEKHDCDPPINSTVWCPMLTWILIEVLSPKRLEKYFPVWQAEGDFTAESLLKNYKGGSGYGPNKSGPNGDGNKYCRSDDNEYPPDKVY